MSGHYNYGSYGDDDIYDRPEYLDDHMRDMEEIAEQNTERADGIANEQHDLSELF